MDWAPTHHWSCCDSIQGDTYFIVQKLCVTLLALWDLDFLLILLVCIDFGLRSPDPTLFYIISQSHKIVSNTSKFFYFPVPSPGVLRRAGRVATEKESMMQMKERKRVWSWEAKLGLHLLRWLHDCRWIVNVGERMWEERIRMMRGWESQAKYSRFRAGRRCMFIYMSLLFPSI